ncbi:hypothetical protein [Wolbachia endosymbiont (group A) of Volucella bombylans]|uniref:hypothetical protein n=1 Tax=Wolbachia endosymbiont (group A) of Volucella bombylans TaxID=3066158 RepID=UPI003132F417
MPASLKFESAAGTAAATLSEVKLVTLADNTGNEYTLDITTNDLKVRYTPNGGQITEHKITGLSTALGSLLSTKDNNESVLVDTLGNFLDSPDKAKYDGQNNQTVKEFLVGKGLKGANGAKGLKGDKGDTGLKGDKGDTGPKGADGKDGAQGPQGEKGDTGLKGDKGDTGPKGADGKDGAQGPQGEKGDTGLKGDKGDTGPKGADGKDGAQGPQGEKGDPGADGKSPIAAEKALQEHVTKISIESPEFKRAVQEEMSQPYFEPPTSDDAALNWTW